MLALSPLFSTSCGWPLEDQMVSHEENGKAIDHSLMNLKYFSHREPIETYNSSNESQRHQTELDASNKPSDSTSNIFDASAVKKLNHNARERGRRRKLNDLYFCLQSLLPPSDRKKRLSVPKTVSQALKYIPELQKQVEKLEERKEEILSSIHNSRQLGADIVISSDLTKKQNKVAIGKCSLPSVSTSQIDDRQVVIQISAFKASKNPLPMVLLNLEVQYDIQVLNVSSATASYGNMVFYTLHLQVKEALKVECGVLSERVLCLCEWMQLA